jgi:hypothetical protein
MEYRELKRWWYEHVNNEDENTPDANYYDNRKARFDQVSALFDELMDTGLAPIIEQKALARETYRLASTHHYSLYQQQQSLMRIVSDLERRLTRALIRDRALNQARGNKQLISRKRGKRSKRGKKGGAWTAKYKKSINCNRPRGFSQKQYCKYGK